LVAFFSAHFFRSPLGEAHREHRALAGLALHRDVAAHQLTKPFSDRNLFLYAGGEFRHVAAYNTPTALIEARRRGLVRPNPKSVLGRVATTKSVAHVADVAAEQPYLERDPFSVASVELGGIRTCIGVPMLKDQELIGVIGVYRQEVRPFTDKHIALLTSFASQAVIAIENARPRLNAALPPERANAGD
jgi:GAF domain-containing protein